MQKVFYFQNLIQFFMNLLMCFLKLKFLLDHNSSAWFNYNYKMCNILINKFILNLLKLVLIKTYLNLLIYNLTTIYLLNKILQMQYLLLNNLKNKLN